MAFYGRKEELSVLKEALDKKGFRGILLWGRRHIGKSTLISEAIKNFDGLVVYYQCLKADDATNLQGLLAAYALGSAYSGSLHFGDIADFFEFVLEREKNRKVVFILDEYPYWRERPVRSRFGFSL
jgi:AAA+ ATPase superfamily predicted ATPase